MEMGMRLITADGLLLMDHWWKFICCCQQTGTRWTNNPKWSTVDCHRHSDSRIVALLQCQPGILAFIALFNTPIYKIFDCANTSFLSINIFS